MRLASRLLFSEVCQAVLGCCPLASTHPPICHARLPPYPSMHAPPPHCTPQLFSEVCQAALGRARRRGYCLSAGGQPQDHPWPMAAEELRYLKFNAYQLEG